ncbi:MAG: toxin-antitoxin system HicB family antitoxin [Candidatus Acidiferrales bacterium]
MRRSNFALRLQPSLMEEVRKAAEAEGVALNQLINVAVAEKLSALRTEEYFRARSSRANRTETMRILARAGRNNEPISGDELPEDLHGGARKSKWKRSSASGKDGQRTPSPANKVRS